MAEVQRDSSSLKGQRRNLSSVTKVLSSILAAAQHLDSSCTDCWNRAVRFGRPDLLEVCANSDSPLVEAVESEGGEGLRTSFWNGYDLTTRRGRERLNQFCPAKRTRHVWFSSPCRESLEHHRNVCLVFWMGSQPWFRECKHLAVTFILHNHSAHPVGDRIVRNHRVYDKKHKHGRLLDLSSEPSLQFPKSLCQKLAKQFLWKDSWHSVLGILGHVHPDEDERPFNPSASSHETPMEVDRGVDVPPPALPPPALPPPAPLVVDAGPNSSERKEITN